jgi:hypothetical protein
MEKIYDTSPEKMVTIRERVETMMVVLAQQMDSHPQIIGICMVAVMGERYGRDGLEDIVSSARSMRQTLINEEKATAKAFRASGGPSLR